MSCVQEKDWPGANQFQKVPPSPPPSSPSPPILATEARVEQGSDERAREDTSRMAAKEDEKIALPCKWITRMEAVALASSDGPLEQSCRKS